MGCASSASDPRTKSDDDPDVHARDDTSKTRHARASSDDPAVPSAPSVSYQVRLRGGPLTQEAYNARLSGVNGCVEMEVPLGRGRGAYALRYALCSQRGYYPEAPDKRNQDAYVTLRKFRGNDDEMLFGVFDGHGELGTECATFVAERLPKEIAARGFGNVSAYEAAFRETNSALRASAVDDSLSGTTAIVAHIKGRDMYVMNVGDSRATMAIAARNKDGEVTGAVDTVDLSSDQTPFRADECERVKRAGARVLTLDQLEGFKDPTVQCWGTEQDDDGDPPRLWAKNGMYPGTAFTRSIGDAVAERIGVLPLPEIEHVRLSQDTKAVILASDGVFEFIPSTSVVKAAMATKDPQQSSIALVVESYKLWLQYETRTDDITVIVMLIENFPEEEVLPPEEEIVSTAEITPLKSVQSVGALFNFPDRANPLASPFPSSSRPRRRVMPTFTMQTRRSYRVVHPYGLPTDITFQEASSLEEQMGDLSIAVSSNREPLVSIIMQSFLFYGVNEDLLNQVARAMYKKRFHAGDVIVTQNDKNCLRAFYVVHSGELTGKDNVQWTENEGAEKAEKKQTVKVRSYGKDGDRMCFNEQCMAHAQMPHETVTATSDGVLWVLDFATYSRIMRGVDDACVSMLTCALRSVDALKTVSIGDLRRVALRVVTNRSNALITARTDELIARQGELLTAIHVINKGEVACTVRANARDESEQPRLVLKLSVGQYFGERALLSMTGAPCATNIQSLVDDVEIWRVTKEDISIVTGTEVLSRTASSAAIERSASTDRLRMPRSSGLDAPHERRLSFGDDDRATREALYMTLLGHMRQTKGALKEATVQISLARTESLSRVQGVLRERRIITELTAGTVKPPQLIPIPGIPSKDASFISIPYPFVPRCALEAVIACGGGSNLEVVRYYVAALTVVLEYLHSMDIVFRGMDPETMVIDERGALRITDFRFAKRLSASDKTPGRTFTVCGVAAYMAPEVVRGIGHDERADWFSLGAFIAHLMRGTPPFGMTVAHKTYEAICECDLTSTFMASAEASIPDAEILARCLLVVDPEARMHSAASVKQSDLLREIDWDTLANEPPPKEVEALTRSAYRGRGVPPIRDATEPGTINTAWVDEFMALDTIAP